MSGTRTVTATNVIPRTTLTNAAVVMTRNNTLAVNTPNGNPQPAVNLHQIPHNQSSNPVAPTASYGGGSASAAMSNVGKGTDATADEKKGEETPKFLWMPRPIGIGVAIAGVALLGFGLWKMFGK